MDEAAVHVDKKQDLLTVYPVGRLDSETSPKLLRQLEPEMEGIEHVIIDFTQVDYISSGGMRLFHIMSHMPWVSMLFSSITYSPSSSHRA